NRNRRPRASRARGTAAPPSARVSLQLELPALERVHHLVDRVRDREVEHLAVERRVVALRAARAEHLAAAELVLARALRGVHDARGRDVDDVQRELRVGDLLLAAPEDAEELLVARLLAAELGDLAGDHVARAEELLGDAGGLALELRLLEVVAVDDVEASALLQVRLQDRLRLAAELVA